MTEINGTPTQLQSVVQRILTQHGERFSRLRVDLATNFEVPAQRLINAAFNDMGIQRFTRSGDDLFEAVTAQLNGWDYEKPPADLVRRWAAY